MSYLPLKAKKIAILVESQYIAPEIQGYIQQFSAYGAKVDLMSRLWGQTEQQFVSEVEEAGATPENLTVWIDFTKVDINDYAAIIMAANYASVRLRWLTDQDTSGQPLGNNSGRFSPAVQFIYQAMMNPQIIKGFPCHALWILSPIPEVLAGRKVTCNRVMLGDVNNAGGIITYNDSGVVIESDLVTSDSDGHRAAFIEAICQQIQAVDNGTIEPIVTAATTPSANLSAKLMIPHIRERNILMLLSEWGYWGEELIGPLEEFDQVGYQVAFCTPTGRRPNAITVSMNPLYIDPPLGRSVTSYEMAKKVEAIDNPNTSQGQRLNAPINLSQWFPERPYWSDPQFVRLMEIYYERRRLAEEKLREFDALVIVGGSGPIVDLANNQRVHDLILAFYQQGKPIAAECYGVTCLAFARNLEDRKSIIWGKRVTGHCLEYDYKDGTGFMESRGQFLDFNMGPPAYPLEYILRDATGPEGAYIGNFGHPTSVIVDYPFITGRSTPDSYLTGQKIIEALDGDPPLRRWGW